MDVLVSGLTHMSKSQIAAISHLLTPAIIENIGVAAALPRSNQGRKRQEDFIAKQVRLFVAPDALAKLNTAVELAKAATSSFEDPAFAAQADAWFDALLLDGDNSAFDQVVERAQEADVSLSWQDLKDLVRQVQVSSQEEAEAIRAGSSPAGASDNDDLARSKEGMDPDLREILEGKKKSDLGAKRRALQRARNLLRKTLINIVKKSASISRENPVS